MAGRTLTDGTTQTLKLNVNEGLYVLRYLGSVDPQSAPAALVKLPSTNSADADIIDAPGLDPGEMPGPGSNVVLLVRRSGSIEVLIGSNRDNMSLDARFSLDLLAPALSRPGPDTKSRTRVNPGAIPNRKLHRRRAGRS